MTPAIPTIRPFPELDYYDSRSVLLPVAVSPIEAWNLLMAQPQPVLRLAFRIRDAISARFGANRVGGFTDNPRKDLTAGDRLDFFTVEAARPDALVLTARDSHLDVMTTITTAGRKLTVTASVVTHNSFGRAYMLVVGPAHKLIVAVMLRKLRLALKPDPA
ncbi:DUF2867 domain-containing protein [Paracoccus caeni]|uniref:DUF2867 domain-containing protein n=1 Tax=Paracoccus caeni TaxID=657651 RepID=A0A934SGU3_9RHOB|nr:DUF2867 domain-containing protein [Paracoccus caeni]MBK4217195.1 DUF2867 domain-containing protein [Paracoccus caeni]